MPLLGATDQQIHTHEQAVHQMHKEIVSNAENAAAQMGTAVANKVKNATNAHYIADVKNAAVAKIKDNNAHAAQLHQLANAVTAQNAKVAAKANEYLNSAVVGAANDLHMPGTCFGCNFHHFRKQNAEKLSLESPKKSTTT